METDKKYLWEELLSQGARSSSCAENDVKDAVLELPIHDSDISKETSSLQEVPSDTNVGESSLADSTSHEESTLNKKNDVNICSIITEPVHEESLNLHDSESMKDSKEDTISKSKRDYLYLTGSLQLQNVSTESNTISNSGIGDVNLKIKDGEKEQLCPLIPPGNIWNANIQYYT